MSCSDYGSDELIFDYESDFEPSWIAIDESNKDNEKNYVNGIVPPYPIPALQSPKKKQIEESIPIDSTEVDWFWACPRCTYWCESTVSFIIFSLKKKEKKRKERLIPLHCFFPCRKSNVLCVNTRKMQE